MKKVASVFGQTQITRSCKTTSASILDLFLKKKTKSKSHVLKKKKLANFCRGYFTNVFFCLFMFMAAVWDLKKKNWFWSIPNRTEAPHFWKIEVGQLFYFKTLLFIANLKSLMCFFWDFEAFPVFHTAPNCKMLYFHTKTHQFLDKLR